jgi:hypothetical protein
MPSQRRANASLALMGAASAGLYALLALRYPLADSVEQPRAGWADLTTASWAAVLLHLAIYLGLTVLYIVALRLLAPPDTPSSRARTLPGRASYLIIVLIWAACCGVLLNVAPAGESHDIFDYIFRGRMMAELGGNPLADIPREYNRAPYYRYLAWHSHVDTYGPMWEAASAAIATGTREALKVVGGWDASGRSCPQSAAACRALIGYVTGYRLAAVALAGCSAALIAGMVRRNRPSLVAAALLAWLWNPLLLVSTAIGAHNDALMIAILLIMLWFFQRHRWFLGLLALALAAHVKLTALILAPVVGLWLARRCGWRRAISLGVAAALVGLALSWLLYAPFGGWATLPRMLEERAAFLANSPWHLLNRVFRDQAGWPAETSRRITVGLSMCLAVAGSLLIALWMLDFRPRRWKTAPAVDWSDDRLLWRTVAAVSLFYLLLGSFWFQHWYLVWVLAPAALLPDSRLTRGLLPWLGFGALSANVMSSFVPALASSPPSKVTMAALLVAIIWVPMLVAVAGGRGPRLRGTKLAETG